MRFGPQLNGIQTMVITLLALPIAAPARGISSRTVDP